jgi:hypothetical protein
MGWLKPPQTGQSRVAGVVEATPRAKGFLFYFILDLVWPKPPAAPNWGGPATLNGLANHLFIIIIII